MPIDMSAASTPTRRNSPKAVTRKASTPEATPRERREEGLLGLGQTGQMLAVFTGNLADAGAIGRHWPRTASALADLAETNAYVARTADMLSLAGPYTMVVASAMPLILQILANHKRLDAKTLAAIPGTGVVPPEILEAEMQVEVARLQAEAVRMQAEAARAQRELEREIASYNEQETKASEVR